MSKKNIQFTVTGPKADLRPLLVRIGTPDTEAYDCPEYPKWVDGNGRRVLVANAAEEAKASASKTLRLSEKA
jgi:hypothetical protein